MGRVQQVCCDVASRLVADLHTVQRDLALVAQNLRQFLHLEARVQRRIVPEAEGPRPRVVPVQWPGPHHPSET